MAQSIHGKDLVNCFSDPGMEPNPMEDIHRGNTETSSNGRWTALTPCENGRDVSNLVQFVNLASNGIKEAIDKSSPSLSLTRNPKFTYGDKRRNCETTTECSTFPSNIESVCGYRQKHAPITSSTNPSFTRNGEQTFEGREVPLLSAPPRTPSTPTTGERGDGLGNVVGASGKSSLLHKEGDIRAEMRKTAVSSSSSFKRNAENAYDDRRKRYFNSRESGTSNPLRVLKVEPLNVVKSKSIPERGSSEYPRDSSCDTEKVSDDPNDENIPSKRRKMSNGTNGNPERPEVPESAESLDSKPTELTPLFTPRIDGNKSGARKKSATVNPLPLRKRRLPASFWQEPGKAEKNLPATSAEPSTRHAAFLPIAPRRAQSFGRYVKDFLGSNLSASEKLELLRLNSLERENYNHLWASRELHRGRCSSYPCVLMHCRNQHDNFRFGGFPGIPTANDYHLHAPPGVALAYPSRGPYFPHHDRLPNVLGLSYPSVSPYFSDIFHHEDVIDSPCGPRLILPTLDPAGSPLFPLPSQLHPSIVRPVPKKHLSNISGSFHPLFDVR